jgi:hypothetical protein
MLEVDINCICIVKPRVCACACGREHKGNFLITVTLSFTLLSRCHHTILTLLLNSVGAAKCQLTFLLRSSVGIARVFRLPSPAYKRLASAKQREVQQTVTREAAKERGAKERGRGWVGGWVGGGGGSQRADSIQEISYTIHQTVDSSTAGTRQQRARGGEVAGSRGARGEEMGSPPDVDGDELLRVEVGVQGRIATV